MGCQILCVPFVTSRKEFEGYQEIVDGKPQGEKVTKLDPLALGHSGLGDRLAFVVAAVFRREEHRYLHNVRGRKFGGLPLDVLLLRRVRGESVEREYRERNDDLTPSSITIYGLAVTLSRTRERKVRKLSRANL